MNFQIVRPAGVKAAYELEQSEYKLLDSMRAGKRLQTAPNQR